MLLTHYFSKILEAGTDEAGRGCLAGPVTAAALILPKNFKNDILNDSKQLSEKTRETLKPIIEQQAVSFAVTHIYPDVIDEINILNASILGMQKSILKLKVIPIFTIVDGNRPLIKNLLYLDNEKSKLTESEFDKLNAIPNTSIIKGDEKYMSIAAASVLAKTYRDEYMNQIHEEYPMYNWKKNKGYPTKEHREAIRKYGITKYHRKSFRLLPETKAP
jgi:ribonuclease HII